VLAARFTSSIVDELNTRDMVYYAEGGKMSFLLGVLPGAGMFFAISAVGAQAACLTTDYGGPFWVDHCGTSWDDNAH
jgi:hypothetical protein